MIKENMKKLISACHVTKNILNSVKLSDDLLHARINSDTCMYFAKLNCSEYCYVTFKIAQGWVID